MYDWLNWFISLIATAIHWMQSMQIFGVSLISFIIGTFIMGVILRALLVKA